MTEYRFSNAFGYNHTQLSEMHNESFTGYFADMTIDAHMSADFWRLFQIDAQITVAMHDQAGAFVGIARIGKRGRRGWCGGFGITPAFRGTGASRVLAEQMIKVAREAGLETLQLEVLTQNIAAFKVYQRAGFETTRKLYGLEIAAEDLPAGEPFKTEVGPLETVLALTASQERASWQLEWPALLSRNGEGILATGPDGKVNALIMEPSNGGLIRVQAASIQSNLTDAQLAGLLRQVAGAATRIQIFNESEHNPLLPRYRALGFYEIFSQYEMFLKL